MAKRKILSAELKQRFQDQGYSMSAVARELDLYVNSLRSWLRRNRFPEAELKKLVGFAGLPKDLESLERKYIFELAGQKKTVSREIALLLEEESVTIEDAVAAIENEFAGRISDGAPFHQELRLLLKALGKGDSYACLFYDDLPYELQGHAWSQVGEEFSAAVERGAHFLYLSPNDESVSSAHAIGHYRVLAPEVVKKAMTRLCERVAEELRKKLSQVQKQVHYVPAGPCPFSTPGHQYMFVKSQGAQDGLGQALLRLPTNSAQTARRTLTPLPIEVANDMSAMLASVLEESRESDLLGIIRG